MNKIYFVRHGETEWNYKGVWQGWSNVALSPRGQEQAAQTGLLLQNVPFTTILSSDLDRAYDTAKAIQKYHSHIPITKTEGLREIYFGAWEGLTYAEIEEQWPGKIMAMYEDSNRIHIPEGEEFATLQKRSWAVLKEAMAQSSDGDSLCVVCHGGTIRTLLCKLLHMDLKHAWNFKQSNGAITVVDFYDEEGFNMLQLLNYTQEHVKELNLL